TVSEWHGLRMRVESELFFLAAHWADLHSGDALLEQRRRSGRRVLPGMERAKRSALTARRRWRSSRQRSSERCRGWGMSRPTA
ncbi:MAG: hypothetical protein ACRDOW_09750, partial [Nocardioidaceae bacterium]